MMHKEVEVYVDDMMVKSETREKYFEALDKFLARLEKYNLRLNPKKCIFGVTSGKLLGHIVSERGIEVESFAILKAKQMAKFIEKSLICRYGVPHHIVTDNGVQFQAETAELLQRYSIEHHKSSPYRLQANGAVKAANKNVKRILSKMVKTYKDWSEYLPFALWGHRTTMRTAT